MRANTASFTQLMDLLDLQQKEETLKEVHYTNKQAEAAREQANETEAQSQILFLFTIVTVIFVSRSENRFHLSIVGGRGGGGRERVRFS